MQVNREVGEKLHQGVLDATGAVDGLRVLDAYAGIGIVGRELARRGALVTAIEMDSDAVKVAREHAPNGFSALAGRVETRLAEGLPADLAILNPPRTGVDPQVLAGLDGSGVERILYVSCDPATLARDVERLGSAYSIVDLKVFDLFPQTAHVETLLVLQRQGAEA
jgi:23S rRNA (uracil1939-C5)-methyltransferase